MSGSELRSVIKASGVALWKVAKEYGIADKTFSKKLRGDFSEEQTQKILAIVEKLKA